MITRILLLYKKLLDVILHANSSGSIYQKYAKKTLWIMHIILISISTIFKSPIYFLFPWYKFSQKQQNNLIKICTLPTKFSPSDLFYVL